WRYLKATVPDVWTDQPVRFLETYLKAMPAGSPEGRARAAIEIWGLPVSRPMRDPNNPDFTYQRFQRGILHYDATSGVAGGILLGEAFRQVIPGQALPPDLAENMELSPYLHLFDPSQVDAVAKRPQAGARLVPVSTNLAFAFVPG